MARRPASIQLLRGVRVGAAIGVDPYSTVWMVRLPDAAHSSRPWRIHEVTRDFRLEDVWALPTPGGADDFPRLVRLMASFDAEQSSSRAVRALFAVRWKIGGLLRLDRARTGLGSRVPSLRERLPADLRDGPAGPRPF